MMSSGHRPPHGKNTIWLTDAKGAFKHHRGRPIFSHCVDHSADDASIVATSGASGNGLHLTEASDMHTAPFKDREIEP
jgi:hypothetical protein